MGQQNPALVPVFWDDDRCVAIASYSYEEIRHKRRNGLLIGWYVDHGKAFVLYRPKPVSKVLRTTMCNWHPKQSGYAGPIVLQLKT